MSPSARKKSSTPEWLQGRGIGPRLTWALGTDGPLTALAYCRESGETLYGDEAAGLYRVDRKGEILAMTRVHEPVRALACSDDGAWCAALIGDEEVVRLDERMKIQTSFELPDICLSLAMTPFGNHLLATLADGRNLIYNERKRRIAQFETIRPLMHSRFCTEEDVVIGAAEHGLVCCHQLSGAQVWQEKLWSNVGSMHMTGDGDLIYLASFTHGIQVFDGDGAAVGSYVLDGTVNRLAVSYEPHRLIAASVERGLYWLDADGELLWATTAPADIVDLQCDPFGEWAICGLGNSEIIRIDWGRR